ncbi:MAG: histidine kinase [Desulfobacteraceae bacterium]|nr:histidine kinase [Desulfobacteraceae bacterium]
MDTSKKITKESLLELIDALPLAISVINTDRTVDLANKSTYLFVNRNEQQLIGHVGGEAFGCIHHDDVPEGCGFGPHCLKCKLRQTVAKTYDEKKSYFMVETTMVFKDAGEKHLRISTSLIHISGGDVVLLAIEDMTEQKKYDQALVEKEKLSAAIETAGAVCHEINQPLMIIMGFADLLLEDLSEDNSQRESISEIKKQSQRLGEITRKLMTITKYKTKKYLKGEIVDIDAASIGKRIEE